MVVVFTVIGPSQFAEYDILSSGLIYDLNVAGTAACAGEGGDGLGDTAGVLEDVDDGGEVALVTHRQPRRQQHQQQ